MSNQKKVTIINVKRSSEGRLFKQVIFESIWLKREDKLKEQGWMLADNIKEIITEKVEDGKGSKTVEIVEEETVEDEVVEETEVKSYEDMTVKELQAACDEKGITYHHASKSKKLISLLEA